MKHHALFPKIDKSKKNKVLTAEIFVWRFNENKVYPDEVAHNNCFQFFQLSI